MEHRGNTIRIPDGYYTASQVAEKIGKSKDTVQRWRELGYLPYEIMDAGLVTVYLFDDDALKKARRLAGGSGRLENRYAA